MNSDNLFKIFAATVAVGLVFGGAYIFLGVLGVLLGIAVALAGLIFVLYQRSYVSLNEMQVGVVFNRSGNFVCFLDNDYGRIEPYKRPNKQTKPLRRHYIHPIDEQMTGIITKGSQKAEGKLENFRTVEGVPIKIKWSVSFKIVVTNIKEGVEYKMARSLPENASRMVGGKTELALHHLIEKTRVQDLYSFEGEHGALQHLEIELRDQVRELTAVFGTDIGDRDVSLGPIELPAGFEEVLQAKFKMELQTKTLVNWARL